MIKTMVKNMLYNIQVFILKVKCTSFYVLSILLSWLYWLLDAVRFWLHWLLIVGLFGIPVAFYISLYLNGHFQRDQEEHYTVPCKLRNIMWAC
ncbi:hypothetical protein C0J52_22564 [Blattella germanica]|nr:hypothetical protein C0J52_22564 [Blattella germanica]